MVEAFATVKITRIPLIVDSAYYSAEWDVPRAAGCHLMQVVDYMEKQLQIADASRDRMPQEALEWYRFGGYLMEHIFARHAIEVECSRNASNLQRPGALMWCLQCDAVIFGGAEITSDHCATRSHVGIHATPDAVLLDEWRLKEWKCTWKSQRRAGGDGDADTEREHLTTGIWRWPAQTKGYAYLLGTYTAQLDAFFVNGKYAPPIPSGDSFHFEFNERELAGNWSAVVNYARSGGWLPARIGV